MFVMVLLYFQCQYGLKRRSILSVNSTKTIPVGISDKLIYLETDTDTLLYSTVLSSEKLLLLDTHAAPYQPLST